ncbi:MAG: hypothetical protein B2I17_03345 [Thermoplasmatales archaeon B_DKE]|nr:MAG: hypothetical protein B2I17_03345 [Thermoplasmatales archaeon B_DKE]
MTDKKPTVFTSEIDRKLTMQCDISFQWKDISLESIRKFDLKAVGFLFSNEDKTEIVYYFPVTVMNSIEGKRALTLMGAVKTNELWSIRKEINEPFIKDTLIHIMAIPSVTIDMILLDKSLLKVRFRFHPLFTDAVSDAVLNGIRESDGFSIEYFGSSGGLLKTLLEISSLVPLSGVEFSMTPDPSIFSPDTLVFKKPWIRIRKYDSGDFKLHHIYYFLDEVPDNEKFELVLISKTEHLYEAYTVNPVINYLVSESEKLSIFNDSIHRFDGTILSGRTWIPTSFISDYMKILGVARLKFPEWNLTVKFIASIDQVFLMTEDSFSK